MATTSLECTTRISTNRKWETAKESEAEELLTFSNHESTDWMILWGRCYPRCFSRRSQRITWWKVSTIKKRRRESWKRAGKKKGSSTRALAWQRSKRKEWAEPACLEWAKLPASLIRSSPGSSLRTKKTMSKWRVKWLGNTTYPFCENTMSVSPISKKKTLSSWDIGEQRGSH